MDTEVAHGVVSAPLHTPRPPHLRVHRGVHTTVLPATATAPRYAHQHNQHPPAAPLPPGAPGGPPPVPAPSPAAASSTSPLHRSPPAPPITTQQPRSLLAPVPQQNRGPTTADLPPPPPRDIASLGRERQGRARNEYVDSPTLLAYRQNQENHNKLALRAQSAARTEGLQPHVAPPSILPVLPGRTEPPHTQQPQPQHTNTTTGSGGSNVLKKENSSSATGQTVSEEPCQDSIICQQCGKCRCHACTQPRELPRRWLCHHNCELSLQKMVEVSSCLCCVKALFYHGLRDCENEDFSSDDPCACCERPHCFKRWGCMGLLSLCLPCLCCYWPLRCCLHICTSCYNGCSRPGCNCRRDKLPGSKRLLIDSESSST